MDTLIAVLNILSAAGWLAAVITYITWINTAAPTASVVAVRTVLLACLVWQVGFLGAGHIFAVGCAVWWVWRKIDAAA